MVAAGAIVGKKNGRDFEVPIAPRCVVQTSLTIESVSVGSFVLHADEAVKTLRVEFLSALQGTMLHVSRMAAQSKEMEVREVELPTKVRYRIAALPSRLAVLSRWDGPCWQIYDLGSLGIDDLLLMAREWSEHDVWTRFRSPVLP